MKELPTLPVPTLDLVTGGALDGDVIQNNGWGNTMTVNMAPAAAPIAPADPLPMVSWSKLPQNRFGSPRKLRP